MPSMCQVHFTQLNLIHNKIEANSDTITFLFTYKTTIAITEVIRFSVLKIADSFASIKNVKNTVRQTY